MKTTFDIDIVDGQGKRTPARFTLAYDLVNVRQLRIDTGYQLGDKDSINKLVSDPAEFAFFVWHTVREQAKRSGITEQQFVRAITPNLATVADCWLEAAADFFESIDRSALAVLARELVAVGRSDHAEQNELMTQETGRRIASQTVTQVSNERRERLEKLLGDEENASDDSTLDPT